MATLSNILQIVLPKRRANPKGTAYTSTYANQPGVALTAQDYRAHLRDLFVDRTSQDSRELLKDLFKYDSDISAAVHAYLTAANTEPHFFVYNQEGVMDKEGYTQLMALIKSMTTRNDYSLGFTMTKSLRAYAEDFRYMILLRGGFATEMVFNKLLMPSEFRHVDARQLKWYENTPGVYKPHQVPEETSADINLDIPNFFVGYYRQNPTEIYPESIFVSAINTVAARQQVINDLYRIMQKTGYPRIEAIVLEDVLRKNAPVEMQSDESKMSQWINERLNEVGTSLNNMRADSAWVHTDAVEAKILNEKGPSTTLNVEKIIEVLNAQNQAGLKTMATVIGRGEAGVNTASVEARIFSLAADSLNYPIADLFAEAFTLALRMTGYQGYVECKFAPVELRPETELEPQRVLKQSRLLTDLSLGLITDDEYHIWMYHRPRPDAAPELAGTGFYKNKGSGTQSESVSPNSDPLGRSVTPAGSRSARSNGVQN